MSLILDALKKLERDKETGEPGVIVVGAVPWEGVRRRRTPVLALTLIALVVIVGIWFGAWRLSRSRPSAADTGTAATAASAASPPTAAVPNLPLAMSATLSAPAARQLTLPGRAAETAPVAAKANETGPPPRPEPQLNAISQQDGRPVAVINGKLVREGDSVDGVRILRIGETEVEVEVGGRRRTLRF